MEVLYRLRFEWNIFYNFIVFFIIFIIIEIIAIIVMSKNKNEEDLEFSKIPKIGKIFPSRNIRKERAIFACIFTIILFCLFLVNTGRKILYVYNNYYNNNFNIVEGEVEQFVTNLTSNKSERFKINNIEFEYSDNTYCGYNKIRDKGGVIMGNGQMLKIGYINYNSERIIVSIEQR